jgi:hypothetical protein
MPTPFTAPDILNDPDYQKGIATHFIVASRVYKKYLAHLEDVFLNEQLLFEAIGSCYCDVYRLRVFRDIKHEDVHKRAAFLMKWISKFKPLQMKADRVTSHLSNLLANEIFAVAVALTVMDIDPEKFLRNPRHNKYTHNIVYLLLFHSCEAEQLASELFLLEQYVKGQATNDK